MARSKTRGWVLVLALKISRIGHNTPYPSKLKNPEGGIDAIPDSVMAYRCAMQVKVAMVWRACKRYELVHDVKPSKTLRNDRKLG